MSARSEKRIVLKDLRVGMIISQDIVNKLTGEIIIKKNTMIDDMAIINLQRYIVDQEKRNYSDEAILQGSIPNLPKKDRESFVAFKNSYAISESKASEYLLAIEHGKAINTSDVSNVTNDIISHLNFKSDVFSFLNYLQRKDDYLPSHSVNLSLLCNIFGKWLNFSEDEIAILTSAGMLHDVGYIKLNPAIVNKKGRLTPSEFEQVKQHAILGYELIKGQPMPEDIKISVLQHHERIDGSGYPYGIKNDKMNKFAKVVAICDVYEAMISDRPYRDKICPFKVIKDFERSYLGKLDTEYLMVFLKNIAYNYLYRKVELSDGRKGEIVFINTNNYSSPIVQLEDGKCIDLLYEKTVTIENVL